MHTFLHVGDVHLQAGHPRNADRLASLDQIVDDGLRLERLAAWLIPGDLFHARSSVTDRNDLAERLALMATKAPVVLVRGNHDQPGDLDIFARLKTAWPIYLATRPGVITVPLPTGAIAAIACLPYPDKFGLVAAGVAPGEVVPTAGELLDVICMQLAHELEAVAHITRIPLFAGHANIRGAIASTGQPQIGLEIELDQAILARLPAVYCALNHIHKPQEVGAGVYAGSIAAMDHGETEAKSYVVLEVAQSATGWVATWTRQPLRTPPMFHVDGTLTRTGFQCAAQEDQRDSWAGCDVRVRYTYKASEKALLDDGVIRQLFGSALRLKVEAVAQPDRELRAPAVAAAKTLPEKLAAYRQVEQLEPSVTEKLSALERHDPAALLVDVAATITAIEFSEAEEPRTLVGAEATIDEPALTAQGVLRRAS